MKLPNKIYDIAKWCCLIVAPALVVLLNTLTELWQWNIPVQAITGTISAVALFVGAILGFSTYQYNKTKDDLKF